MLRSHLDEADVTLLLYKSCSLLENFCAEVS